MAYINGERTQSVLFPPSISDYVDHNDPVHAYDAFIDLLDLGEIGIVIDDNQIGPPEFHPLKKENLDSLNTTDPQCIKFKEKRFVICVPMVTPENIALVPRKIVRLALSLAPAHQTTKAV